MNVFFQNDYTAFASTFLVTVILTCALETLEFY